MVWLALLSSKFAPWWGVFLQLALLGFWAYVLQRLTTSYPALAFYVPVGALLTWFGLNMYGIRELGWSATERW